MTLAMALPFCWISSLICRLVTAPMVEPPRVLESHREAAPKISLPPGSLKKARKESRRAKGQEVSFTKVFAVFIRFVSPFIVFMIFCSV